MGINSALDRPNLSCQTAVMGSRLQRPLFHGGGTKRSELKRLSNHARDRSPIENIVEGFKKAKNKANKG